MGLLLEARPATRGLRELKSPDPSLKLELVDCASWALSAVAAILRGLGITRILLACAGGLGVQSEAVPALPRSGLVCPNTSSPPDRRPGPGEPRASRAGLGAPALPDAVLPVRTLRSGFSPPKLLGDIIAVLGLDLEASLLPPMPRALRSGLDPKNESAPNKGLGLAPPPTTVTNGETVAACDAESAEGTS